MGKSRYIKDDKGVTMSVATSTLGLEKPLLNENYNIDVHNRNMDKIDEDLTPIDDSYIIELFQHDGDTSRPRDYYTKEEADEKYATKEEVENIDLSNLATKEEANNALNKANEAFQRGDNVKTQLVDKLISEGLNVSTNQSFEELIGSIALGKRWVSGSLSNSGSFPMTITINANFTPRIAFVHFVGATTQAGNSTSKNIIVKVPEAGGNNPQYIYYNTTEFTTSFNGSTSIIIQKGNSKSSVQGGTIDWIVFE